MTNTHLETKKLFHSPLTSPTLPSLFISRHYIELDDVLDMTK